MSIALAPTEAFGDVAAFYATAGYGAGVADGDAVLVARHDDRLVGAVRLCDEGGVLVLRGMQVAAGLRRRGIGRALLAAAVREIAERECWCVPYRHLETFYAGAGFVPHDPAEAPAFLAERLRDYVGRRLDVVIMRRPGASA